MSWLRLDDAFPQHPKFEGWTAAQKWAFLELMSYCAKYRTDGRVPNDLSLLPRTVTPALIARAESSGWIDRDEHGDLWVHDFPIYNPSDSTNAQRQQRHRARKRNENRNGESNDDSVTDPVTRNAGSLARAPARRASRPVPKPSELPPAGDSVLPAVGSETTESLPIDKELATAKILEAIGTDADEQTHTVVASIAKRLPAASLAKVEESLRTQKPKDRAAYAVGALQSEFHELATRNTAA